MYNGKKIGVVIPSAGTGKRMGNHVPKQFLEIDGAPVILRTLRQFQWSPEIDEIVVVTGEEMMDSLRNMIRSGNFQKVRQIIPGGEKRQDSVWNGLQAIKESHCEIVLVHDSVRPFVTGEMILNVIKSADEHGAAIIAVPVKETVKLSTGKDMVDSTPSREQVWIAQTPQAFRFSLLYSAHERARTDNVYGTDESSLVERMGIGVTIISKSRHRKTLRLLNLSLTAGEKSPALDFFFE
jgi:2-C-methyl-D-erythritol 4-phosphate cytidylyltransferase